MKGDRDSFVSFLLFSQRAPKSHQYPGLHKEAAELSELLHFLVTSCDLPGLHRVLTSPHLPPRASDHIPWHHLALILAVESGKIEVARFLIFGLRVDAEWSCRHPFYLPMVTTALLADQQEMAIFLMDEASVDTSASFDVFGRTSLMVAALKGQVGMMRYLATKDPRRLLQKDAKARGVEIYAALGGSVEAASFPLEVGLAATQAEKNMMLHVAAGRGHLPLVAWMVEQGGADPEAVNDEVGMAQHNAAYYGHLPVLQWLMTKAGTPIDGKNRMGRTALHLCALNDHREMAKWLVEGMGAEVSVMDRACVTPRDLATKHHGRYLVAYFKSQMKYQRPINRIKKQEHGQIEVRRHCPR